MIFNNRVNIMKIDVDSKQRMITAFYMLLQFYKIIMGTFLVIFVPQKCGKQLCSATEQFMTTDPLRVSANACNFVTFASIGTLYFIELKRENWCIEYLDIDEQKSNTNLDTEIELYPKFKKKMNKLNNQYIKAVYVVFVFMVVNFIVSGTVIYQKNAGSNTLTTFISFFMLVSIKLYSSYNVGAISVKDERANSAYMKTLKTYNTIDKDHRIAAPDDPLPIAPDGIDIIIG